MFTVGMKVVLDELFFCNLDERVPNPFQTPSGHQHIRCPTIISRVALACASGHHTATPDMNWKSICTQGISLSYLTCVCQSLFPLAWQRSSWQVSQVVSVHHGPTRRVVRTSQWNNTRVFSMNYLRVQIQITSWFDV